MASEQQEPLIIGKNKSYNLIIIDALNIISLATPKCLENIFYIWCPFFITTIYAGHISLEALAIASLGFSIYKGTIRVIFRGLRITGATIFGQAYGYGNYNILGIMLQSILIIALTSVFISGILYVPMEYILKIMGQGDLSAPTAFYLQCLIPFSFFDGVFWSVSVYLQAQKIVMIQNAIAVIGVALEYFSLWFFIYILKLDWRGLSIGYGTSITFCTICIIIVLIWWHKKMKGHVKDPWVHGFSHKAFGQLKPILTLMFYGSIINIFSSVGTEFLTIISGLLENPTLYVATIGILINILDFGLTVLNGISISGSILIATEVGKGDKKSVKFIIYVVFALLVIFTTIIITFLIFMKNQISSWWSTDPDIQNEVSISLIYICFYIISFMITSICTSILVGVQRQRSLFFVTIFNVIGVGVPLPLILCFIFNYGFQGLLLGYMTYGFVNAIGCLFICCTVNWDQEIINANERYALIEESLNKSTVKNSVVL